MQAPKGTLPLFAHPTNRAFLRQVRLYGGGGLVRGIRSESRTMARREFAIAGAQRGTALIIETRPVGSAELDPQLPAFLRSALAARGIARMADLDLPLSALHPPTNLPDIDAAAQRLATAVTRGQRILIAGDFDADGATACALCVSLLRAFGVADRDISYLVPNRFEFGYGFTPEFAAVALERRPDVIVTVDNGVSSVEGVALAQSRGVDVVVTDHHLPGDERPPACALVNPNLPESTFPSRHLAGVGVAYYVMGALRAALKRLGHFKERGIAEPRLADWLDLVAIGTVADVVPLDRNNRILVYQGLQRIRHGRARVGVRALAEVAGRALSKLAATDLGFAVAPRLNAAGRLQDMAIGIECLLADDLEQARRQAQTLDELNRERRRIEADMSEDAAAALESQGAGGADDVGGADDADDEGQDVAICVYESHWHQGVVGIVAARMRERYHRPAIAFADAGGSDEIKGSARSIPGLHIRDAIADCAARDPGLVGKFGGHAMAAGLSIKRQHLARFRSAFNQAVAARVSARDLAGIAVTDGELGAGDLTVGNARLVGEYGPWGQGFDEPTFHGEFDVVAQRIVGERHLKLALKLDGRVVDAIAFNQEPIAGDRLRAVYRLGVNDYRDAETLQLNVQRLESALEQPA